MNNEFKPTSFIYWMNTEIFNQNNLFEKGLTKLCEERFTITQAYSQREDQNLSMAVGLMLDYALSSAGFDATVLHDKNHRPYVLDHPELFISCTHCNPYAGIILSNDPVGIDIESQAIDFSDIVKHYYSDEEKNFINTFLNENDKQKARTDLWCRKECLIKFDKVRDLKALSGLNTLKGYRFISQPIINYSFEILLSNKDYLIRELTVHDFNL